MITGELKSKIDAVWNDFWSGGIANPLEVMEQLTYLLFIKGLDERQTLAERHGTYRVRSPGQPLERRGTRSDCTERAFLGKLHSCSMIT